MDECPFCSENPDTILHTMGNCEYSINLWNNLKDLISPIYQITNREQTLNSKLFGYHELEHTHPLNIIHSLTRLHIWNCRHKNTKPNIHTVKSIISTEAQNLKAIYKIKLQELPYSQEWLTITQRMQPPPNNT